MFNRSRVCPYPKARRSESDHVLNKVKTASLRQCVSWESSLGPIPYEPIIDMGKLKLDNIFTRPRQNSSGSFSSEEGIFTNFPTLRKSEPSLASTFDCSLAQTTSICIKNETIAWDTLKEKLDCHPRLEELTLEDVEITNIHLKDSKVFLPHLKTFTFVSQAQKEFDWEEIFFFYTKESKKSWAIKDIWNVGVNIQVSCKDWFMLANKSESKLAFSGRSVQEEFGSWGLSEFLQNLVKTEPLEFPKYVSIGAHMVLKSIAYAAPVEIIELNLVDIKAKTGCVNTMLKSIKGMKTFRYISKVGDALEYSSISPETIGEVHLNGISVDFFDETTKELVLPLLKCMWLSGCWIGNAKMTRSMSQRFPQLEYLTLHDTHYGVENFILDPKDFPSVKHFSICPKVPQVDVSGKEEETSTTNHNSGSSGKLFKLGDFRFGSFSIN